MEGLEQTRRNHVSELRSMQMSQGHRQAQLVEPEEGERMLYIKGFVISVPDISTWSRCLWLELRVEMFLN